MVVFTLKRKKHHRSACVTDLTLQSRGNKASTSLMKLVTEHWKESCWMMASHRMVEVSDGQMSMSPANGEMVRVGEESSRGWMFVKPPSI